MSFHHMPNHPNEEFISKIANHAYELMQGGRDLADALTETERECARANCEFHPKAKAAVEAVYDGTWEFANTTDAQVDADVDAEELTDDDAVDEDEDNIEDDQEDDQDGTDQEDETEPDAESDATAPSKPKKSKKQPSN